MVVGADVGEDAAEEGERPSYVLITSSICNEPFVGTDMYSSGNGKAMHPDQKYMTSSGASVKNQPSSPSICQAIVPYLMREHA